MSFHLGINESNLITRIFKLKTLLLSGSLQRWRVWTWCECTYKYPLLCRAPATLGGELQDSQQCSQSQAQGENQEHPLEAVQLHGGRLGPACDAAAGPPLAAQVSQLPSFTQLKDRHTEVLYQGRTLRESISAVLATLVQLEQQKYILEVLKWAASPRAAAMLYPLMPTTSWALTSSQCRATAKSRETDSPIKAKLPSFARRTPSSMDDTKLLELSMCS